MIFRKLSAFVAGCTLLLAAVSASAVDRGPSTADERKHALDIIAQFDADPLNPPVSDVEWVVKWAIEIPDIHVKLCMVIELPKKDKKHSQTLFNAMMMAQVAYGIQHFEDQSDIRGQYLAGIEGMLRAYQKIVSANPKDRQPALDDLLQRRDTGTLASWVKEKTAGCNK